MRLEIFGHILEFKRDPIKDMERTAKKGGSFGRVKHNGCKVALVDDSYYVLTDNKGYVLPGQLDLVIESKLNAPVKATCSFHLGGIEPNPLYHGHL